MNGDPPDSILPDRTHDASALSWLASANAADTDFPLQNLPYGRFRTGPSAQWRLGVAIGDAVLDLAAARAAGLTLPSAVEADDLAAVMALAPREQARCRRALFDALGDGSACRGSLQPCLHPQSEVEMGLPCAIPAYSDFFIGIHHAREAGRFARPDAPLTPNYKWVPIAYNGRASSIVVSGTAVRRPWGQVATDAGAAKFEPTRRLDYELEVGVLMGRANAMGEPVSMREATDAWFGLVLLNDWSAREVQRWESQPLGPFLGKSFATSISPWVVTRDALVPFRVPVAARADGDPSPLPHLACAADAAQGAVSLTLEAWIQARGMDAPHRLMRSNFAESSYWTIAQMIAHHTSNGCNLATGDLLGTGTQSGPGDLDGGCLLELTRNGSRTLELPGGRRAGFLEDGDRVELRGHCERAGFRRIGLGACSGVVLPAHEAARRPLLSPSTGLQSP